MQGPDIQSQWREENDSKGYIYEGSFKSDTSNYFVDTNEKLHLTKSSRKLMPRRTLGFILAMISLLYLGYVFLSLGDRKDNIWFYVAVLHAFFINLLFNIFLNQQKVLLLKRKIITSFFVSALLLTYLSTFVLGAPEGLVYLFGSWIIIILLNGLFYLFTASKPSTINDRL